MQIESKWSDNTKQGLKRARLLKYDGQWLSIGQIAERPEIKEKGLNYDMLYARFHKLKVTDYDDFFRPKRFKKTKVKIDFGEVSEQEAVELSNANEMILSDFGSHKERKKGEVFCGYMSRHIFELADYWTYQRLGPDRVKTGFHKGKFPYFLLRSEVRERGWKIRLFGDTKW